MDQLVQGSEVLATRIAKLILKKCSSLACRIYHAFRRISGAGERMLQIVVPAIFSKYSAEATATGIVVVDPEDGHAW